MAAASSPYLRQHAHNPVDWHEWNPETLKKAKAENKPLIISIGYSTCHWCHVMARESFMDKEVAAVMNAYFICVKIDREERPDIDAVYIEAAQKLNGNAGWPLNVFALPDGKPFWAGTYFPKNRWLSILEQIHKIYKEDKRAVNEQADALTEAVSENPLLDLKSEENSEYGKQEYINLKENWLENVDFTFGGFHSRQKFPMPSGWDFLMQYHYLTRDKKVWEAVEITLDAMALGGIYDQLGGGFARYATDQRWFAPHFEKMLYDNAQLISLYANAYSLTQKPLYRKTVEQSLEFIHREMTSPQGGFYSALNADSEEVEGKFYVWTEAEIDEILDKEEANIFKSFYGVKSDGNWEDGQNILYRKMSLSDWIQTKDIAEERAKELLKSAGSKMMEAKSKRVRPSTDDKILTSWNALMLKAYAAAYRSLKNEDYLNTALKNACFIEENLTAHDEGLYRSLPGNHPGISGFLDDYAFLADAYIELYQVTFEINWLNRAKELMDYVLEHFQHSESGMFYYTSDKSESLIARQMEFTDSEMPSSNAVMATNLFKLGLYFDDESYSKTAENMLIQMMPVLVKGGPYFGKWASLAGMMFYSVKEIAIMGSQAQEKALKLMENYLPTALFCGGMEENLPLLEQRLLQDKTMIYVCQNKSCQLPEEDAEEAMSLISID